MPRVKRGTVRRAKRKKLLERAKGFYQTKSKLYRQAKESVDTALKYAYVGRKNKKREYRRLWTMPASVSANWHRRAAGNPHAHGHRAIPSAHARHRSWPAHWASGW